MEPMIDENHILSKVYFYLEDEGLTDFHSLGGRFIITEKGKNISKSIALTEFFNLNIPK
jgi:hypothetical protein